MASPLALLALHPAVNLLIGAGLLYVAATLSFFPAVVFVLFICITYVVVGPRVQRSRSLWRTLFPSRAPGTAIAEGDRKLWSAPTLIISHQMSANVENRLLHTLGVNCPYTDNAVFCVPASRAFHLPLSRVVLYLLGGVVPYSRNVVINLLNRNKSSTSSNVPPVVVACPDEATQSGNQVTLNLKSKGVFAAALKTGACVVPCVTVGGKVYFGTPILAVAAEQAPSPDAVVGLANQYAKALESLYERNKPSSATRVVVKA